MAEDSPSPPERGTDLRDLLPPPDPALLRARRSRSRRRRREHRSWPQRALLALLVAFTLLAGGMAGLAGYALGKLEQIERVEVALSEAPPGEPRNYLLVGSDSRDGIEEAGLDPAAFLGDAAGGSGQRADTIMVVRVDPGAESVDVLSLPRDLWLPIAGTGGSQRINTAYAGGPQRLVDTIEEALDIPLHHYVEVDFAGFAGLVDALGGVPVWFDTPVRDLGSGLHVETAGCHVLDPQAALALARARHLQYRTEQGWRSDGTGDLGRITRQQVFLRRALDRVSELDITDALTFNRLLDVAVANVTLDRGLGLSRLADLGRRFAGFSSEALRSYAVPVTPFRTSGGAEVLRLEEAEAQPVLNLFRGLPPDALAPVQVRQVTVLNGTGHQGEAALVADALRQVGFGIERIGDLEPGAVPLARTRIRHAAGADAAAGLLERHLTAGAEVVLDPTLDEGEVVLETGADLTTIGRRPRPAPLSTAPAPAVGAGEGEPVPPAVEIEVPEPIGVAPDPSVSCR